jgi:hypothetical protein
MASGSMARISSLARRATPVRVTLAVLCLHPRVDRRLLRGRARGSRLHQDRSQVRCVEPRKRRHSDRSGLRLSAESRSSRPRPGIRRAVHLLHRVGPVTGHRYIDSHDEPAYRYQRILYPMLARFTALEQPSAVPWTMLAINLLSVGLGVLALGSWLRRKGISSWLAALYGL